MAKILVSFLSSKISKNILEKNFSKYGNLTSIKIKKRKNNTNQNIAFINFSGKFFNKKDHNKKFWGILDGKKIKIQILNHDIDYGFQQKKDSSFYEKSKISSINNNDFTENLLEITNFPITVSKKELESIFGFFGKIIHLYIKKDNFTFENRKRVVVNYENSESVVKAACFIEKKIYMKNVLQVKKVNTNKKDNFLSNDSRFKFFKNMQYENAKNFPLANNSWISFFIGNDYVLNDIKNKFGENKILIGETKKDFYDKNEFILSEGRIRAETKLFLKKEGIPIDFYSKSIIYKKSRHCFFIKWSFSYKKFIFHDILKKFGQIKNFYFIVQAKIIIIEYKNSSNANTAFEFLKRSFIFQKNMLIDWLPLDFISKKMKQVCQKNIQDRPDIIDNLKDPKKDIFSKTINFSNLNLIKKIGLGLRNSDLSKNIEGKLIIRNIPFKIKSLDLKKIFLLFGKIVAIRIPKKNGKNIGYAFIDYKNIDDAKKAILYLQNTKIASRNLKISLLK